MCKNRGMTVVVITHNKAISPMADRVIELKSARVNSITKNDNPADPSTIEW